MRPKDEIERLARAVYKEDCGQVIVGKGHVIVCDMFGPDNLLYVHHERAADAALAALQALLPPVALAPAPPLLQPSRKQQARKRRP